MHAWATGIAIHILEIHTCRAGYMRYWDTQDAIIPRQTTTLRFNIPMKENRGELLRQEIMCEAWQIINVGYTR